MLRTLERNNPSNSARTNNQYSIHKIPQFIGTNIIFFTFKIPFSQEHIVMRSHIKTMIISYFGSFKSKSQEVSKPFVKKAFTRPTVVSDIANAIGE
jgi:hypothetical protein